MSEMKDEFETALSDALKTIINRLYEMRRHNPLYLNRLLVSEQKGKKSPVTDLAEELIVHEFRIASLERRMENLEKEIIKLKKGGESES